MKKFIAIIMLICAIITSAFSVHAKDIIFFDNNTKAYVDGKYMEILENEGITPVIKDGIFYVPLRSFVEFNNGYISWKSTGNQVEANVILGSNYAIKSESNIITFFDGTSKNLNAEIFLNNNYNRLMVPADTFEKLGYTIAQINNALGIRIEGKHHTHNMLEGLNATGDAVSSVKVDYSFATEDGEVKLSTVSDSNSNVSKTAGKIGTIIGIDTIKGVPLQGQLVISYDPSKLGNANEKDLKLARYNPLEDKMELLTGVKLDVSAKTLSATIGSSGEYVLVDGAKWVDAWAKQQLLIRENDSNRLFNVSFVLDVSGSMKNDIGLLKEATLNFISALSSEDYVSITTFENKAKTILSGKFVKDITENDISAIKSIASTGGGTNMHSGFEAAPVYAYNLNAHENLLIVLSDGETSNKDKVIEEAKEFGRADTRIISLALGDSADVALMELLAQETNGIYQYVNSAKDLQKVFEMIRGASIGLETDTDGDGIPDLIETTGMRDQYGNLYTTNPNNADTDGDSYSDGEEMGILINGDVAYFKRKSDPNIPSDFPNKANVKLNINNVNISTDNKEYGTAVVSFTLDYIHFEDYLTLERVYQEPQNINVLIKLSDCLELVSSNQKQKDGRYNEVELNGRNMGGSATGSSEKIDLHIKCKEKHEKKHDVIINVSGSNFDTFEQTVTIDYKEIEEYYLSSIKSAYSDLIARIKSETETKINSEMKGKTSVAETQKTEVDSVYKKYFLDPINNNLTEDELFAVKKAVLNFADETDMDLTIDKDDSENAIIQKIERWLLRKEKRTYIIEISNGKHKVEVTYNILGPQVSINSKDVSCLINTDSALGDLKNLQDDLDELAKKTIKDAGKELIFLSFDTVLTNEVMDEIDNKVLEAVDSFNPNISQWLKFYKYVYDSTTGKPNYKKMKTHCDEILEQDFSPNTKEIAKKIIEKIEQITE